MNQRKDLLEKVEIFQNMLISYSRYESAKVDPDEFTKLRDDLLHDPVIKDKLPRFVRTHRDFKQFWGFIKHQSPSYEGRRQYLCGEFTPLLDFLEHGGSPSDVAVSEILSRFDVEHVHQVWTRALERRSEDPDGAITSARTLLESVCKHILDECNVAYGDDADLPKLYTLTADGLRLAPGQRTEQIYRQAFGRYQ